MNSDLEMAVQEEKYLTFYLGGQLLALGGSYVSEIIFPQEATWVPGLPDYIPGVINLRGKILPLVDLKGKLGITGTSEKMNNAGIIVVSWENHLAGLIVDQVKNVTNLGDETIEPPPSLSTGYAAFSWGITHFDGEAAVVLNLEKVLA